MSALCLGILCLAACQGVYYKTMQKLGKENRDILVQRVKESKKDQEQAKEQLKTTMESFQELTGFQGGSLEKSYKKLNSEYEASQARPTNSRSASSPSTRSATTSSASGRKKSAK